MRLIKKIFAAVFGSLFFSNSNAAAVHSPVNERVSKIRSSLKNNNSVNERNQFLFDYFEKNHGLHAIIENQQNNINTQPETAWDNWDTWNTWSTWSKWDNWNTWDNWNNWDTWNTWNNWGNWNTWNTWSTWNTWNTWGNYQTQTSSNDSSGRPA